MSSLSWQLGAEDGVVLKRGGNVSSKAASVTGQGLKSVPSKTDEEAAANEAARRRAAARAKAVKSDSSGDDNEGGGAGALDKILGQRVLPTKKNVVLDRSDGSDESDSSSGSGSDSSSSSSSEEAAPVLERPMFVSKTSRTTVKDDEQIAREEEEAKERAVLEDRERVRGSKALLAERVAEVKNAAVSMQAAQKEVITVNVNDGDETEEYELWKVRELTRMKNEREERRVWGEQKAEILRRRAMDDDEIVAEDGDRTKGNVQVLNGMEELLTTLCFAGEKAQPKFLQRYYHKGAFYQDELEKEYGDVDFSAPTGVDADIADKSLLPKGLSRLFVEPKK
jgi:microfibrillar-associated protein 1